MFSCRERTSPAKHFPDQFLITFASAAESPICDIEQLVFRGYIRGCHSRPQMKSANRRENPRIDIKLRCHISSPALWAQSASYTKNISRSGVLIGGLGGDSGLPRPAVG